MVGSSIKLIFKDLFLFISLSSLLIKKCSVKVFSVYKNNAILRNKRFFSSIFRFNKEPEKTENVENNLRSSPRRSCSRNEVNDDDLDFDIDLDDTEEEDN